MKHWWQPHWRCAVDYPFDNWSWLSSIPGWRSALLNAADEATSLAGNRLKSALRARCGGFIKVENMDDQAPQPCLRLTLLLTRKNTTCDQENPQAGCGNFLLFSLKKALGPDIATSQSGTFSQAPGQVWRRVCSPRSCGQRRRSDASYLHQQSPGPRPAQDRCRRPRQDPAPASGFAAAR